MSQVLILLLAMLISATIGYFIAFIPGLQLPGLSLPDVQVQQRWHLNPDLVGSTEPLQIQAIAWAGTRTPYFEETVAFFRDVLQLDLSVKVPQFAAFTLPNGDRFDVFELPRPINRQMKGVSVEFLVPDIDKARAILEAKGVQFIDAIERDEKSGIAWTQFWGPDGNLYGLNRSPQ
jgi:catechol 2,3-dioxygenase-like lactoylglutathione lyase family enzyme